MIPANELRIGNYADRLYWNPNPGHESNEKEICKIVSVQHSTVNIELKNSKTIIAKYSLANLFPIPLTPGELERCGFEKSYLFKSIKGDEGIVYSNNNFPLDICVFKDGKIYLIAGGCEIVLIKYLHQLQNLWLDLTSKELETKDSVKQ